MGVFQARGTEEGEGGMYEIVLLMERVAGKGGGPWRQGSTEKAHLKKDGGYQETRLTNMAAHAG